MATMSSSCTAPAATPSPGGGNSPPSASATAVPFTTPAAGGARWPSATTIAASLDATSSASSTASPSTAPTSSPSRWADARWPASSASTPRRARSLTLCGTTAGATNDRVRALQSALRRERGEGGLRAHALAPGFPDRHPALALLFHQIRRLNPPRERGLLGPPPASYRGSAHQTLIEAGAPIAFIVGEHDRITSPELIREARSLLPGAELFEIAGAGHSTYFEQPAAFNDYALAFLARVEADEA